MSRFAGTTTPLLDAARNVYFGNVNPAFYDQWNVRLMTYYHRVNVTSAGFTSQTFFDGSTTDPWATNFPQQGSIESDKFFWCLGGGFFLESGHNAAYGAVAAGVQIQSAAVATTTFAILEQLRRFASLGRVIGKVGNREFWNGHGLHTFPAGQGSQLDALAAGGTIATRELSGGLLNLGKGTVWDCYKFLHPQPFFPQKKVVVTVDHKAAFTVATDFVLGAQLFGVLIEPSNY